MVVRSRMRRQPTNVCQNQDNLKALRLRREAQSEDDMIPTQEQVDKINAKADAVVDKGKLTGQEIRADLEDTQEREIPDFESGFERTRLSDMVNQLPESVPEPPKVEQIAIEKAKEVAPAIAGVVNPALGSAVSYAKSIGKSNEDKEYDKLKEKWSKD